MASTKYSSVLGTSNMDFTPADITATGVLPSSVRSEDISIAAKKTYKQTHSKQLLMLYFKKIIIIKLIMLQFPKNQDLIWVIFKTSHF